MTKLYDHLGVAQLITSDAGYLWGLSSNLGVVVIDEITSAMDQMARILQTDFSSLASECNNNLEQGIKHKKVEKEHISNCHVNAVKNLQRFNQSAGSLRESITKLKAILKKKNEASKGAKHFKDNLKNLLKRMVEDWGVFFGHAQARTLQDKICQAIEGDLSEGIFTSLTPTVKEVFPLVNERGPRPAPAANADVARHTSKPHEPTKSPRLVAASTRQAVAQDTQSADADLKRDYDAASAAVAQVISEYIRVRKGVAGILVKYGADRDDGIAGDKRSQKLCPEADLALQDGYGGKKQYGCGARLCNWFIRQNVRGEFAVLQGVLVTVSQVLNEIDRYPDETKQFDVDELIRYSDALADGASEIKALLERSKNSKKETVISEKNAEIARLRAMLAAAGIAAPREVSPSGEASSVRAVTEHGVFKQPHLAQERSGVVEETLAPEGHCGGLFAQHSPSA